MARVVLSLSDPGRHRKSLLTGRRASWNLRSSHLRPSTRTKTAGTHSVPYTKTEAQRQIVDHNSQSNFCSLLIITLSTDVDDGDGIDGIVSVII